MTDEERITKLRASLSDLLDAIDHFPGVHNPTTRIGRVVAAVRQTVREIDGSYTGTLEGD